MKKVLYTKYNSLRKTEYQIKTSIIDEDGKRYVIKEVMNNKALKGIERMKKSYAILKDTYKKIIVIPYTEANEKIKFEFIKGDSLIDDIDFKYEEIDTIVDKIKKLINVVLDVKEEYIEPFSMSDKFSDMFPGCIPDNEKAFKIANIDSILSNFVKVNDDIYCIDYEWVCDFDIPVNYIVYRTVIYLYNDKAGVLSRRIGLDDFLEKFGFESSKLEIYNQMEECFQQYVHGEKRKFSYLQNYNKKVTSLEELCIENTNMKEEIALKSQHIDNLDGEIKEYKNEIDLKDNHIDNLNSQMNELNKSIELKDQHINNLTQKIEKVRHSIKNPIYGVGLATKKVYTKTLGKKHTLKTEKKTDDKYAKKYRDLMGVNDDNYEDWIKKVENKQEYRPDMLEYRPKISVVVPVYNTFDKHLVPCIESVLNQTYDNWELCLADDNSTMESVKKTLKKYENNEKVKVVYRKENGHISKATNSALEVATGEFVAFMDCDDTISDNALYEVVKKLNEDRELDFIYSDEDKIEDDGTHRHMPHFKPDWSPDTFMSLMYTSHLGVYRKNIVDKIGGLRIGFEGSQDYDLTLRFTELTQKIAHIPKVLYHWRVRPESTAASTDAKPYILEAAAKAKKEALERRKLSAEIELVKDIYQYRVNYNVIDNPLVSIIIPSKDNYRILERCIKTLTDKTGYKNYEIILVDNGSNDENKKLYTELSQKNNIRYIYQEMDFNFSRMCNIGVQNAKGDYYLFLNDDIEIIESIWLERMLGHAQLKHIGAVGAKLLYPNDSKIQHDGVVNFINGPVHILSGMSDDNICYFNRNKIEYNYLAVTAACLMIKAGKFDEVNGFDEELAVAYNDVDLCFKLYEKGYYNVVRNDAVLIHHESVSRGDDLKDEKKHKRLADEAKKLYIKHPDIVEDPFYNENLSQNKLDFSFNANKVRTKNIVINEETMLSYDYSKKISSNIDFVHVVRTVYIEGWAFIRGYNENNDTDIRIILYNDKRNYILSTNKVYRPDVAANNKDEINIDFTGFRCEFLRERIDEGKYLIDILCNNERMQTGKAIEV